jgi:uncharacterized membrane protein
MGKNKKHPNNNLPPSHNQNQVSIAAARRTEFYSGPLPHPEILKRYNEILPDAAAKILSMVERQELHRHELENMVINSDCKNARLGLHYGLIIGMTAVVGGIVCTLLGHEIGGSIIGGIGLAGLVSVFVYGSKLKREERQTRLNTELQPPPS